MNSRITRIFLILVLMTAVKGFSQNITTTFYDYKWQPCDVSKARFYGTLEKTDSGWLRNDFFLSTQQLQMSALYKDSACKIKNGDATYFHANGNLSSKGNYINNKREGIHLSYHFNGMMADSGYYHNDKIVEWKLSWHPNGFMADSVYQKDDSTTIDVSWFDNGSIDEYGYFINQKKQGKWNYFHRNGNIACTEMMDHGKIVSVKYFDETGKEQTDTSSVNSEANI
jgi:antitoxin component YwqK of YwqJK toxin-antitoxin module